MNEALPLTRMGRRKGLSVNKFVGISPAPDPSGSRRPAHRAAITSSKNTGRPVDDERVKRIAGTR
jgi:hypothetical protein